MKSPVARNTPTIWYINKPPNFHNSDIQSLLQVSYTRKRDMSPISKMQLVVFAVVLILPAFQSGGFLFGYDFDASCMEILVESGEMKCLLEGYGDFVNYDPFFCTLECSEPGSPKVPPGVCSGDVGNCTESTREDLVKWHQQLEQALSGVLLKKCPSFSKM